jgi:hypothetical protein
MRIYLKGGGNFAVKVTEFTVRRDQLTGEFNQLDWKADDGAMARLRYLALDQVAAIVREDA